ncbi:glycosyltransferase [Rhodococcoides kyotonense]|uniref:UDP:flavonoid glycosyltransferase YjiC, YdhE family n=1 Tax=Rhodococcoides kyotonense TaxID=398843 RepID=A0A239LV33_9NOCA|nr:nucleotide disphospho-sugar-binding domain-containing protein [Rhodococcus kyotonensis]SNT34537.1 UDP:flavonoid glycosyltransferase YjiC, YdhE family [Rhodococcus kyotonensis]
MKFVLPFTGSRGDVQPGLTLGVELARRGHDVVFGAPPNLVEFATAASDEHRDAGRITVRPFGPDTKAVLESELVRVRIKSRNPRVRVAALAELANLGWDDMVAELVEMSVGADALLTGTLGQEVVFNMAEAQAIPFLALHYCPVRRNGSMSVVPGRRLPAVVNRATWSLLETMRWRLMRRRENAQRVSLGLDEATAPLPKRVEAYGGTEIQAYDGALFPGLVDEWGPSRPFVGFLELSSAPSSLGADLTEGSTLRTWIDRGSAPLYFGFGSMPVPDPSSLVDIVTEACERTGQRALISSGWSAFDERIDDASPVAVVGPVDHASVFPLCRAAIHHGGAGTTAASIRAGLPTMVCWFSADQPFWGAALVGLGAGVSTKFSRLDGTTLTAALETLLTDSTAAAARDLAAAAIRPEDALRAAADLVEWSVTEHRDHQNR